MYKRQLLGLSASDAQAEKSDGSKMMGALVRTVTPGGVADKAGIKKNDLIVAVNGTTVGSSTSLVARVREQPAVARSRSRSCGMARIRKLRQLFVTPSVEM